MTLDILKNLLNDDKYFNKVYPYLKDEYFDIRFESMIFKSISKYYDKYNFHPGESELQLMIEKSNLPDDDSTKLLKYYEKVKGAKTFSNFAFAIDETEEFIQNADLRNSLVKAIEIVSEDPDNRNQIKDVIDDSLGIHFDDSIGLDFNNDVDDRFKYYTDIPDAGFKTDLEILNKITNGGFKRKTLSVIAGEPHSGKTLFGTHMATSFLLNGHNVLYISLEMSEYEIAKRIDSNMLNIKISNFQNLKKSDFLDGAKNILSDSSIGRLMVKEFPTGAAGVSHIRSLIKELKQKKNFIPDVIIVDYLGIMASSADGMYENIKRNAEGLRAIAVEEDIHMMTFSQINRGGFNKAQPGMADLAESTGPAQIADFLAIIGKFTLEDGVIEEPEEEEESIFKRHQYIYFNVVKSRYNGLAKDGVIFIQDFFYMRLEEFKTDKQIEFESKKPSNKIKKVNMGFMSKINDQQNSDKDDIFKF